MKDKIKVGHIMTVKYFLSKFKLWGFSISGGLILVAIGLAIWQKEADYVFYGIPAILFLLYISLPIALVIAGSKDLDIEVIVDTTLDIPKETSQVEAYNEDTLSVDIFTDKPVTTPVVDQVDIPVKTEHEEISNKIDNIVYESMTIIQLRNIAREKGLSGFSALKKSELIELIRG